MAFLIDFEDKDVLFTLGLFGVQYVSLTPDKISMITHLHQLLTQSAGCVDVLIDENTGVKKDTLASTIFVAYWLECADYKEWQETILNPFWQSLSEDAGVWREVMTVPKSRYMYSASKPVPSGLASMVPFTASSDMGYWGVYRHRISQHQDQYTDPTDTFPSSYTSKPSLNPDASKTVVNLEKAYPNTLRKGRVKISKVPNNLCFAREVQSIKEAPKMERDVWLKNLNPFFRSWVDHLSKAKNENGVISFSTHLTGQLDEIEKSWSGIKTGLDAMQGDSDMPETQQLMYFLDLANFELSGRSFKDHVTLRRNMMELYGPGGKLFGQNGIYLMVELCIVKTEDLEAEYVGCRAGTRLMVLEDL